MRTLLDLFCGAGGASEGYSLAGFDVTGVDNIPQPRYPFRFHLSDALDYVTKYGHLYDAIVASPPCQEYSRTRSLHANKHPDLIIPTREVLKSIGLPYVIENVPGAPLHSPIILCGKMFDIFVYRHRLFESNIRLIAPPHIKHQEIVKGYDTNGTKRGWDTGYINVAGHNFPLAAGSRAMEIDWMQQHELAQAIPPVYTSFIGFQLMQFLSK